MDYVIKKYPFSVFSGNWKEQHTKDWMAEAAEIMRNRISSIAFDYQKFRGESHFSRIEEMIATNAFGLTEEQAIRAVAANNLLSAYDKKQRETARNAVPLILRMEDAVKEMKNESHLVVVFRVKGRSDVEFVDCTGRRYESWEKFLEENRFPRAMMAFPSKGFLRESVKEKDENEINGDNNDPPTFRESSVEFCETPSCSLQGQIVGVVQKLQPWISVAVTATTIAMLWNPVGWTELGVGLALRVGAAVATVALTSLKISSHLSAPLNSMDGKSLPALISEIGNTLIEKGLRWYLRSVANAHRELTAVEKVIINAFLTGFSESQVLSFINCVYSIAVNWQGFNAKDIMHLVVSCQNLFSCFLSPKKAEKLLEDVREELAMKEYKELCEIMKRREELEQEIDVLNERIIEGDLEGLRHKLKELKEAERPLDDREVLLEQEEFCDLKRRREELEEDMKELRKKLNELEECMKKEKRCQESVQAMKSKELGQAFLKQRKIEEMKKELESLEDEGNKLMECKNVVEMLEKEEEIRLKKKEISKLEGEILEHQKKHQDAFNEKIEDLGAKAEYHRNERETIDGNRRIIQEMMEMDGEVLFKFVSETHSSVSLVGAGRLNLLINNDVEMQPKNLSRIETEEDMTRVMDLSRQLRDKEMERAEYLEQITPILGRYNGTSRVLQFQEELRGYPDRELNSAVLQNLSENDTRRLMDAMADVQGRQRRHLLKAALRLTEYLGYSTISRLVDSIEIVKSETKNFAEDLEEHEGTHQGTITIEQLAHNEDVGREFAQTVKRKMEIQEMSGESSVSNESEENVPSHGSYMWIVSENALKNKSLDEILRSKLLNSHGNNLENRKRNIENLYNEIIAERLTLKANEGMTDGCLQKTQEFFDLCGKIAENPKEWEHWVEVIGKEESNCFMNWRLTEKAKKVISSWRFNLHQILPYFSPSLVENKLLRSIEQWTTSPKLKKEFLCDWIDLYKNSEEKGTVSLSDLRLKFGSRESSEDDRLFDFFKQSLDDIDMELQETTATKLFEYLEDLLKLEQERDSDSKRIVFFQKTMILSSLNIQEVLQKEENQNVLEISLNAKYLLFFDCSLPNSFMHGKNLSIVSNHIVISEENTGIDVSGAPANDEEREDPKQPEEEGANGIDGEDGKPGESSGNVVILTEGVTNPEWLHVRLNGGNGERGQNGGRGGNGKNGRGVTKEELDRLCLVYDTLYWNSMDLFIQHHPGNGFIEKKSFDCKDRAEYVYREYENEEDGRRIVYSMAGFKDGVVTTYDLYFIVYGGPGGPPGTGGLNGVGGEGGRCGEFTAERLTSGEPINGFSVERDVGKDGQDGVCGKNGDPGHNGNDMAMIDRSNVKHSKCYIGQNGNQKVICNFHHAEDEKVNTRFCGYLKHIQRNVSCFVWFTAGQVGEVFAAQKIELRENGDRKEQSTTSTKQKIITEQLRNDFSAENNGVEMKVREISFNGVTIAEKEEEKEKIREEEHVLRSSNRKPFGWQWSKDFSQKNPVEDEEKLMERIRSASATTLDDQLLLWNDVFNMHFDVSAVEERLKELMNGMDEVEEETVTTIRRKWEDKKRLSLRRPHSAVVKNSTANQVTLKGNNLNDVMEADLDADWMRWNMGEYKEELVKSFLNDMRKYYCCKPEVLKILKDIRERLDDEKDEEDVNLMEEYGNNELDWSDRVAVVDHLKQFNGKDKRRGGMTKVWDILDKKDEKLNDSFEKLREEMDKELEFYNLFQFDLNTETPRPVGAFPESVVAIYFLSKVILEFHSKLISYYDFFLKGWTNWLRSFEENKTFDSIKQVDLETFMNHLMTKGIKSAAYLFILADKENINIQVFYKKSASRISLVGNFNSEAKKIHRILFSSDGNCFSIESNMRMRRLKESIASTATEDKFASESSDLLPFFHFSHHDLIQQWSDAVLVSTKSSDVLFFFRRLFEISGCRLTLIEFLFLLNTVIDMVCNLHIPLKDVCDYILAEYGRIHFLALEIRTSLLIENEGIHQLIAEISDGRMRSLLGSKLHHFDWKKHQGQLGKVVALMAQADYLFPELSDKSFEELAVVAEKNPWINFKSLQEKFDQLGYFVHALQTKKIKDTDTLCEIIEGILKKKTSVCRRSMSLITYLLCNNELVIKGKEECFKEILEAKEAESSSSEKASQERIRRLRTESSSWKSIFSEEERSPEDLVQMCSGSTFTTEDMEDVMQLIQNPQDESAQLLQMIDDTLWKKRKIRLRNTQKIAILCGYKHQRNLLSQVITGEGKSYIILALAAMHVKLSNSTVDIITSSSVLAERDSEEMKDIYSELGISVGNNCDEDIRKREKAYQCKVVYGDVSHFEKDHLLHNFYQKNVLGDRKRDRVIVDEVDSMLLDHGSNMLYLSHKVTGLELLEPLFVFIYEQMMSSIEHIGNDSFAKKIKHAVLSDLFGMITMEDLKRLDLDEAKEEVWNALERNAIVDKEGVLQKHKRDQMEKVGKDLISSFGLTLSKRILALLTMVKERRKKLILPKYLHEYAIRHLDEFIQSALKVMFMQKNDEYVVDMDRSNPDLHPVITIIDKGTGTDLRSSQWNEGLHQFLQLKHGCRLTPMSLKAVFISNVSYLKGYQKINGFSGTLGSTEESDSLSELYAADVFRIVTYKPRKFHEDLPITVTTTGEWLKEIYDSAKDKLEASRSVLLICSSIEDVNNLNSGLQRLAEEECAEMKETFTKARLYRRDFEDFKIDSLGPRELIISTNLAGRGTDIKIQEKLESMGGLHVIITFLPENQRIEDQAFGRAARCGNHGSGQIIALVEKENLKNIFQLKQRRDFTEQQRLRSLKRYYDYHTNVEEECLKVFQENCRDLLKNDGTTISSSENSLLSQKNIFYFASLDEWALLLDSMTEDIKRCERNAKDEEKKTIIEKTKLFIAEHQIGKESEEEGKPPEWLKLRPQPLVNYALSLIRKKQDDFATSLLWNVVKDFPDFSAEAFYYLGILAQQKIRRDKIFFREKSTPGIQGKMEDLLEDVKNSGLRFLQTENSPNYLKETDTQSLKAATSYLLLARAQFLRRMEHNDHLLAIVSAFSSQNIGGYKAQKLEMNKVLKTFVESIDDMLGQLPSNEDLKEKNEDSGQKVIHRRKALLHSGILSPVVLADVVNPDALMSIAEKYDLPPWKLRNFFSSIKKNHLTAEFNQRKVFDLCSLEELDLPSATGFWGSLQRAEIFMEEKAYIGVKNGSKWNYRNYGEALNTLEMGPFDIRLTQKDMSQFKYYAADIAKMERNAELNEKLHEATTAGIVHIEVVGTLNPLVVLQRPTLDKFDSITISTLTEELGLQKSEAEWIVSKLVKEGILMETTRIDRNNNRRTTAFVLKKSLNMKIFPSNIREQLWIVFSRHFSYGYALRFLESCVRKTMERKEPNYRIILPETPYSELFEDMVKCGILVDSRVTSIVNIYAPQKKEHFLPFWVMEKLIPMAPKIEENGCQLKKTTDYMREKGVGDSTELRNAIANGMRQIAYVEKPKKTLWIMEIGVSFLLSFIPSFVRNSVSSAFSSMKNGRNATEIRYIAYGTARFCSEIMRENQKTFADEKWSKEEEFQELKDTYKIAIDVQKARNAHNKTLERVFRVMKETSNDLREYILQHSFLTESKENVSDIKERIANCIQESPLLPWLRKSIEVFLMTTFRQKLVETLNGEEESDQLTDYDVLQTVTVFGTAVIVDVNKISRIEKSKGHGDRKRIQPNVICKESVTNMMYSASCIQEEILNGNDTLQSVLSQKMHDLLKKIVDDVLQFKAQKMITKMLESWEDKYTPVSTRIVVQENNRKVQMKIENTTMEQMEKANPPLFLLQDLQNIFLKITFQEENQSSAVIGHMIRNNFPLGTHCAKKVLKGLLGMLTAKDEKEWPHERLALQLFREEETVYEAEYFLQGSSETNCCQLEITLTNECFFVNGKEGATGDKRSKNLVSELYRKLPLLEFSDDKLQTQIADNIDKKCSVNWKFRETWTRNEKLRCAVRL